MFRAPSSRSGSCFRGTVYQHGQALIYGIFMLIACLAALFFLFNTGQLTREKTKLVNTADAVAYSAGIMHARTLNYMAYTNRAMLANTVAIAQLVSLSSWVQYVNTLSIAGFEAGDATKYPLFYPSYLLSVETGAFLKEGLVDSGALENLAKGSDEIIQLLMTNQKIAFASMDLTNPTIPQNALMTVMNEVAQSNYRNDGEVIVEPLTPNALHDFITEYSGDKRTRFAEVAQVAAKRDGFVPKRSWSMSALNINCRLQPDQLIRRGGTDLVSFDEWKAMDTLSQHGFRLKGKPPICVPFEDPQGWGSQSAADNPTLADSNLSHHDYSAPINPVSSTAATVSSRAWNYSGLPSFYDLSDDAFKQNDPRLQFAIRLRRKVDQTLTSEARSSIRPSSRLNDYHATPAGGDEFVAVSAVEVFFERPPTAHDNIYGESLGKSKEIGSLFNPYWQVRLIYSQENVQKAQGLQGVDLR